MKKTKTLIITLALVFCLVAMAIPGVSMAEEVAAEVAGPIDCTTGENKNGDGWTWTQSTSTFALTKNVNINIARTTKDNYFGLKLPGNSIINTNNKGLWINFSGFESGGKGFGTGVECAGALTINGGVCGVNKDGGDTAALRATSLTLHDAYIVNMSGGGVMTNAINVTASSLIHTAFYPLFNNADVAITGGAPLTIKCNDPDPKYFAQSDTKITSDGDTLIMLQKGLDSNPNAPYELGADVTIDSDLTLPDNTIIPAGKTITVAASGKLTVPAGKTLTNNGTIANNGTLENNGTIAQNGTLSGAAPTGDGKVVLPAAAAAEPEKEPYVNPGPSITEPAINTAVSANAGETATFAIKAENATGYQWYVDKNDGKGSVAISGASSSTYTTGALAAEDNGSVYMCIATNSKGKTISPNFTLSVTGTVAVVEPEIVVEAPQTGSPANLIGLAMLVAAAALALALRKRA